MKIMPIARGIQNGASTHHHDHAITPVSLRTMNTSPRALAKLIPPACSLMSCSLLKGEGVTVTYSPTRSLVVGWGCSLSRGLPALEAGGRPCLRPALTICCTSTASVMAHRRSACWVAAEASGTVVPTPAAHCDEQHLGLTLAETRGCVATLYRGRKSRVVQLSGLFTGVERLNVRVRCFFGRR